MIDERRLIAGIDLLRKCGALNVQIRFSDDEAPTVWFAVVELHLDADGRPGTGAPNTYRVGAALDAVGAVMNLCESAVDGEICAKCQRVAAFIDDHFPRPMLPGDLVCSWQWDSELGVFRRDCEGS